MKILGIIAEYNPFHLGHKYHLEESKRITDCQYSLAVMSGSFVQRGEPAIIDKFYRAKMAILNGIDLVIELPFIYSCQTAEIFAKGSVEILNSLNCVNSLAFGSEYSNIDDLKLIAKILIEEPYDFTLYLKNFLLEGFSFPIARVKALEKYFKKINKPIYKNIDHILSGSNNILGIEYLKQLNRLDSNIKPYIIKRKGNDYKDIHLATEFSSATSIRNSLFSNNYKDVKKHLPKSSYETLVEFKNKYNNYNKLDNYYSFLNYKLISEKETIKEIFDIGEDLGNRFINNFDKVDNLNDLIYKLTSKTHTSTRIQRAILNFLINNFNNDYKDLIAQEPKYIRILGSNVKGFEIINKIKEKSNIKIISKFNQHKKHPNLDKYIELEKKSTDLYYLGLVDKPLTNYDYFEKPFIDTKK